MNQTKAPSILSLIFGFPAYAFNYLAGLALAIVSDITLTSLALGCFFLALASNAWVGLAAFFLVHTLIKIVNALNGAIVQQGRMIATSGTQLAQVFMSQAEAAPKPLLDPVQDQSTGA